MGDSARGPWVQTCTGRAFYLADPRHQEVHLEDIAHALSMQCRYNGHVIQFYSVAQHAVLVSKWMEEDGYSHEMCLAGLHHDSAEAYTGDITSQIKFMVPEFRQLEDAVQRAVTRKFQIQCDPAAMSRVKVYDLIALATERRDLVCVNTSGELWSDMPPPRFEHIRALTQEQAEMAFLMRHRLLEERRVYA